VTELAPAAPSMLVDERYRLVEHVGTGRAGSVWSAVDLRLRRSVAVRLVPLSSDRAVPVLAATASGWTPGMARVYDVGARHGGDAYLVREFVPGAALDARADAGGLPVATIAAVGACVASTLAGLHLLALSHGAVHGGNIVVAPAADRRPDVRGSTATLTDFGMRTVFGSSRPHPADDVLDLGRTLLGAVTARRVVGARTTQAALSRLGREPALRARERRAWSEILTAMTAADPSARPGAATVAAALATLARDAVAYGSVARSRGTAGYQPPPWETLFAS
jgi:serine/threonine protein kinase